MSSEKICEQEDCVNVATFYEKGNWHCGKHRANRTLCKKDEHWVMRVKNADWLFSCSNCGKLFEETDE